MLQRILFRFLYKIKETLIYHQQDIQLSAFFQDPFQKPVGDQHAGRIVGVT